MAKEKLRVSAIEPLQEAENGNKFHNIVFEGEVVDTPFCQVMLGKRVSIFENSAFWPAVKGAIAQWKRKDQRDDEIVIAGKPEWFMEVEVDGNVVAIPGQNLENKLTKIRENRSSNATTDPNTAFMQLLAGLKK